MFLYVVITHIFADTKHLSLSAAERETKKRRNETNYALGEDIQGNADYALQLNKTTMKLRMRPSQWERETTRGTKIFMLR